MSTFIDLGVHGVRFGALAAQPVGRVLVVLTRQIGDVLLSTPLIRVARERWPDARIDVLGFKGTLGILEGNPDIDELVEVQPGSGWRHSGPLIRRLWRRYDLALVCEFSDRAHLYGWVAGRGRAGKVPHQWSLSWWKRLTLAHASGFDPAILHMVLEKLKVIAPWVEEPRKVSAVPPAARPLPPELQARLQPRYVVMHAPSLVRYKQWPPAHYAAVARALAGEQVQVLLTGGPADADRACTAEVARAAASPRVLDLAGQLGFGQLTTLLQGAALYVGPDTSITHLAAACDTAIVTVFGPTDPRQWGPWPQRSPMRQPYVQRGEGNVQRVGRVALLQGVQPCVPCTGSGCERHDQSRSDCLETMGPERVLAEAARLLGLPSLAPPGATRVIPIVPAAPE